MAIEGDMRQRYDVFAMQGLYTKAHLVRPREVRGWFLALRFVFRFFEVFAKVETKSCGQNQEQRCSARRKKISG